MTRNLFVISRFLTNSVSDTGCKFPDSVKLRVSKNRKAERQPCFVPCSAKAQYENKIEPNLFPINFRTYQIKIGF